MVGSDDCGLSMVNVGKLWRGRRRDDGEGFEGVVALALTSPSGCALEENANAVREFPTGIPQQGINL